jgi:hypothetical protein
MKISKVTFRYRIFVRRIERILGLVLLGLEIADHLLRLLK